MARASSIAALEALVRLHELVAHVDVTDVRADRVAADDAALDQPVRIQLHDRAVLEGAGLALVGVDHEVGLVAFALGDEAPLHARGKAGAAAAADVRGLDLGLDLLGLHRDAARAERWRRRRAFSATGQRVAVRRARSDRSGCVGTPAIGLVLARAPRRRRCGGRLLVRTSAMIWSSFSSVRFS